jgi:hypothetical protein
VATYRIAPDPTLPAPVLLHPTGPATPPTVEGFTLELTTPRPATEQAFSALLKSGNAPRRERPRQLRTMGLVAWYLLCDAVDGQTANALYGKYALELRTRPMPLELDDEEVRAWHALQLLAAR